MVVAIDGPAGVGKSTLARHISKKWGFLYLNTGRYYRAVARLALERGWLDFDPKMAPIGDNSRLVADLVSLTRQTEWEFDPSGVRASDRLLSNELHSVEVDLWAPLVSEIVEIRKTLNSVFRHFSQDKDMICEGRDMTSEVFPEAEVRIFLDARPEIRARRRFEERPEGLSYQQIFEAIVARDEVDRNKPVGALRLTDGCVYVDSSDLTIQQVCEKVDRIIQDHRIS